MAQVIFVVYDTTTGVVEFGGDCSEAELSLQHVPMGCAILQYDGAIPLFHAVVNISKSPHTVIDRRTQNSASTT